MPRHRPSARSNAFFKPGVVAQGNTDSRRIEAELVVDPKHWNLAGLGRLDDRPQVAIQGRSQFFGADSLADRLLWHAELERVVLAV